MMAGEIATYGNQNEGSHEQRMNDSTRSVHAQPELSKDVPCPDPELPFEEPEPGDPLGAGDGDPPLTGTFGAVEAGGVTAFGAVVVVGALALGVTTGALAGSGAAVVLVAVPRVLADSAGVWVFAGGAATPTSIGGAELSAEGTGVDTVGRLGGSRSDSEPMPARVCPSRKAAAKTAANTTPIVMTRLASGRRRRRTTGSLRRSIGWVLMSTGRSLACRAG
jgi:hypothetical protein